MIEFRADLPKWEQIAATISERIQTGEYAPGRLISERAVIEEFGDAGNTARKALKALRERGLIYTRVNLGSFVGPDPDADTRA